MNIFFRILLAVYAFCLAIVSLIIMLFTINEYVFFEISNYIGYTVLEDKIARVIMFVIAFAFFVMSVTFLLSGVRSNKDKKAVSKYTNIGEIKISLNSIENIALTASRRLNGVKETKAFVYKLGDSVSITIRAIVLSDINIPALSEDIQVRVKKAIEESSGIGVNEVRVIVENIYTGYKARVE